MKNTFYFIIFIVALGGCQARKEEPKWVYQDSPITNSLLEQAHQILNQYELGKMFLYERGNKTWQDVDAFYRKERDKYSQNPMVRKLLVKKIIHYLIDNYGLTRDESAKARETSSYYLAEYRSVEGINPKIYYYFLKHLQNDWERDKINEYRDYAVVQSVEFKKGLHRLIELKSQKDVKINKKIAKTLLESNRKTLVETDEYVQKLHKI